VTRAVNSETVTLHWQVQAYTNLNVSERLHRARATGNGMRQQNHDKPECYLTNQQYLRAPFAPLRLVCNESPFLVIKYHSDTSEASFGSLPQYIPSASLHADLAQYPCSLSQRSASRAAMAPVPADVIACRPQRVTARTTRTTRTAQAEQQHKTNSAHQSDRCPCGLSVCFLSVAKPYG
jgi:hypothetical protein